MQDRSGCVFVSYRREETRHLAGRLADRLEDRLGSTQVFMDVDSIEPGADFAVSIEAAAASCDVLIVLIGQTWTPMTDSRGRRRIDDPDDFVVLEVGAALDRGTRVVPVLVDGALMPRRDELPTALHGLARRHGVRLDHETFRSDIAVLLTAIEKALGESRLTLVNNPKPVQRQAVVDRPSSLRTEHDERPRSSGQTDASASAGPGRGRNPSAGLTGDDVVKVTFRKPPQGKRGYNEDQVDAFLDLVEKEIRVPRSTGLTEVHVHDVAFGKPSMGKKGYHEDDVDAFLDLVEEELKLRRE